MRQLIWLRGPTTAATSGDFVLTDPSYFYAGDDEFHVPRGCKVKLWSVQLQGTAFEAQINVSHNSGTNYAAAGPVFDLQAEGFQNFSFEGRPLVILESRTGLERMKVSFSQDSGAATSSIALLVEITDED